MPLGEILWVWGEAFLRWLHVIAGIAWIGSSFYFIHLDYSLKRREGLPAEAYGEAWQVHGGGFYNMVKYLVAPARLPADLTWFKWEAYATWISGFALVVAVYYCNAGLYLVDPAVLDIAPATGIALSVAGLVLGWIAYDGLCRSPLGRNDVLLAAVGFALLTALAWVSTRVFSARGAFMQMGALVGTIMAANVLMVIIPGQRKVVADLIAGRTPDADPRPARQAALHPQQLPDPAGGVRDAVGALPARVCDALELGDLRAAAPDGRRDPPLLQCAPPGAAEPVVDLGSCGGVRARHRVALDPGPCRGERAGEARRSCRQDAADLPAGGGDRHRPLQHVPCRGAGVARHRPAAEGPEARHAERIEAHAREIVVSAAWSSAMPPSNVTGMTDDERETLRTWLRFGGTRRAKAALQGEAAK